MDTGKQMKGYTNNSELIGVVSLVNQTYLLPTKLYNTKHRVILGHTVAREAS